MEAPTAIIASLFVGASGIITTYYLCKARFVSETKTVDETSMEQGDQKTERRKDSITRSEHDLCRSTRENTENRLFDQIETNRKESRVDMAKLGDSIVKLTDEARTGREKIYTQIEGLTKKVYKQGGKGV